MNQDYLSPVKEAVLSNLELQSPLCLGKNIRVHSEEEGFPELENVQLAIFGVQEDRNSENNFGCGEDLHFFLSIKISLVTNVTVIKQVVWFLHNYFTCHKLCNLHK